MSSASVQHEDCRKVLRKFLKTDNFQLSSFKVVDFLNPLQGLVGEHFILRIEYVYQNQKQSQDFFLKTINSNPVMAKLSKITQVYEKESFLFYLLDEYEKYNIDTSFAPKGFFFKPYITVIEYIKDGFKGTPKKKLFDYNHCLSSLEAIAKFHASSIIYEKLKEKELGKKFCLNEANKDVLEDKVSGKEESIATQWVTSAIKGLFRIIDLIPENHIAHDEFKAKLSETLAVKDCKGIINGILHSDLWTSNFLHRYENGKPVESKLLDFQMIKYGPIELDISQFLMTTTSRAFRAENWRSLIEHYYKNLKKLLVRADLGDGFPSSTDFLHSCKNFKLSGKVHAAIDHSFTFVSNKIYLDALQSEESFQKYVFEERENCIIESYNSNEEFRNMLREDMLELRDLLFS